MRHGYGYRRLNRTSSHRRSLLRNLSIALITHEQIETTLPKARELKRVIDKLITLGKRNSLHSRRQAYAKLGNDEEVVKKIFDVLAKRYAARQGGYARLIKTRFRYGDNAEMAIVEFIDRDLAAKGALDRQRHHQALRDAQISTAA